MRLEESRCSKIVTGEVDGLRDNWDKTDWVFIPATVCEVMGCRVWDLDKTGIFLVLVKDYTPDIVWIENLGAGELGGGSKPEGITQGGLVCVNDDIVALSWKKHELDTTLLHQRGIDSRDHRTRIHYLPIAIFKTVVTYG